MISQEAIRQRDEEKRARYRNLTLEQRAQLLQDVCRLAMQMLMVHSSPEKIRRYRAPMPESSISLWRRLRDEYAGTAESR